jgi:hypothetical protein
MEILKWQNCINCHAFHIRDNSQADPYLRGVLFEFLSIQRYGQTKTYQRIDVCLLFTADIFLKFKVTAFYKIDKTIFRVIN